jgi:4-hydroxy-tetrahydrodipicolinate synthase
MFKPEGVITPVLTTLNKDEMFDAGAYKAFIDHLIEAGVHGIFPLGTNGEFYAFSKEEKLQIVAAAVKAVDVRDCLSVISPYFVAVSQDVSSLQQRCRFMQGLAA